MAYSCFGGNLLSVRDVLRWNKTTARVVRSGIFIITGGVRQAPPDREKLLQGLVTTGYF